MTPKARKIRPAPGHPAPRKSGPGEGYFRSLTENSSDIVTILESDGIIRYQSPSITAVLGYGPAETIGQSALSFVHTEDLPSIITKSIGKESALHEQERFQGRARTLGD